MLILILIVLLSAFFTSLIATLLIRRISLKYLFLDIPGGRKQHTHPTPLGGGIAVALGVGLPIFLGVAAAYIHRNTNYFSFLPADIVRHAGGALVRLPQLSVIFLGGLVILLLGLIDDRKGLSPLFKLLVETIVALGLALGGIKLSVFMEGQGGDIISIVLTVLWVLVVTNSFNLLDHMDGVCSGVAAVVCISFLIIAIMIGEHFISLLVASILGSVLAFLIFNTYPAKIFLGDAGSLFIGYILSALTIVFTFYKADYLLYSYFVPLVVLVVPIFDTLVVVVIRLKRGKNIFEGDRNHLAHRLLALGMPVRGAVLIVYTLTFCAGLSAILLYQVTAIGAIIILLQVILVLVVVTLLETKGREKMNNGR